ncbi:MAG: diaminopimelate decarboxylase [Bacteroidales bacterium]|nr:diaminopimelate decarboxylase [Bacteroidales bacterium]MDY5442069.1 diaminopimelate decarboxylase [Candidatus Cryptobacteroides sp.]
MEPIKDLKDLQTPCFILDEEELAKSVKGYQDALKSNFARSIVSYSVKTNSVPACMKLAGEMGAYAEVVSHDEWELARLCGFDQQHIVYNGPMKSKETFLDAVEHGAIVNIETKRELEWLKELPNNGSYRVGIRLNINISYVSPEDADGDNDNSRFGFSDETNEFADAVALIGKLPNVELAGLHIHRTAHSRSIRFYKQSIAFACNIIEKHGLQLDYLDVGGGYFGIFPNKPTYQEYSDAFYEVLTEHRLQNLCVIVEPGNAIVASCFAFLSEVIDVKHVEDELWFATTDGSRNDLDPFFKKSGYLSEVHYAHETPVVKEQIVSGCTCLEYDRMFTLTGKPLLSVGDRIYYRNVGAYTMCLSPMFIRYIPNIYLKNKGYYTLVREKWTAKEHVMKNVF